MLMSKLASSAQPMTRVLEQISHQPRMQSSQPALTTILQSTGLYWPEPPPGVSRRGGAGPSDHQAVTLNGETIMVPIYTGTAAQSPYWAKTVSQHSAVLMSGTDELGVISLPRRPAFYDRSTADGIPYWKIATLHSTHVLATTLLQNCIRFTDRETSCQFCAIGQSLANGTTIARKQPEHIAEVAAAAVELDGITQLIMTTGTPATNDRGASLLTAVAAAVSQRVDIPIQGQCEPPADDHWFERMAAAGIVNLGMHLEAVTDEVRQRIMPGKAEVPLRRYYDAFAAAVAVFGRGQVSTYILAGLGDSSDAIVEMAERLVDLGVYPFVVPFVPISGTPLAQHPAPSEHFMHRLFERLAPIIADGGLSAESQKAGCGACGACSTLRSYQPATQPTTTASEVC